MTLSSLMIHTCDILRRNVTRGASGGQVISWTTRTSGLRCRARPLKPTYGMEVAKDDIIADYRFYFTENPSVTTKDYIGYTDTDGTALKLKVVAAYNPHEMDRMWKVYCNTVKDAG